MKTDEFNATGTMLKGKFTPYEGAEASSDDNSEWPEGVSASARKALEKEGITTLEAARQKTAEELQAIKGVGEATAKEILG